MQGYCTEIDILPLEKSPLVDPYKFEDESEKTSKRIFPKRLDDRKRIKFGEEYNEASCEEKWQIIEQDNGADLQESTELEDIFNEVWSESGFYVLQLIWATFHNLFEIC